MAPKAAGDSAHAVKDGAAVDDDKRADGTDVGRTESGRSNEPIKRGVIIPPEPVAAEAHVHQHAFEHFTVLADERWISLRQATHEMKGRDRVGLEGRRVKRGFARPIPARK